MSTNNTPSQDKLHILQFNQIKGVKQGALDKSQWNKDCTQFVYEDQIAEEANHNVYKAAIVDPKTGKILEWKDVGLMQVKSTLKGQNATGETTQQAWSINYKKKLAEQFGTSKSKRKINQMLSNNING